MGHARAERGQPRDPDRRHRRGTRCRSRRARRGRHGRGLRRRPPPPQRGARGRRAARSPRRRGVDDRAGEPNRAVDTESLHSRPSGARTAARARDRRPRLHAARSAHGRAGGRVIPDGHGDRRRLRGERGLADCGRARHLLTRLRGSLGRVPCRADPGAAHLASADVDPRAHRPRALRRGARIRTRRARAAVDRRPRRVPRPARPSTPVVPLPPPAAHGAPRGVGERGAGDRAAPPSTSGRLVRGRGRRRTRNGARLCRRGHPPLHADLLGQRAEGAQRRARRGGRALDRAR